MLLPLHTIQITDLKFASNRWTNIQRFSELILDPLFSHFEGVSFGFGDIITLKPLRHSKPYLLELSVASAEGFHGSELPDFLEACERCT